MGPGMQVAGPAREVQQQQTEQGKGNPAPSPTSSGPALHHTGTGAAQCLQVEGSEAVAPLKGLSGTPEGPARQAQQVGGARGPASQAAVQTVSTVSSRSHHGLHFDKDQEVWEQPRQRVHSRGARQASWRSEDKSSDRAQQASPACAPGREGKGAATHGGTAGDAAARERWLKQLEVWAIDEMAEATEGELSEDETDCQ